MSKLLRKRPVGRAVWVNDIDHDVRVSVFEEVWAERADRIEEEECRGLMFISSNEVMAASN